MKKNTLPQSLKFLALLFLTNIAFAQVGINTTDPKGVIDFNSTTLGVVYPNVALTATNISAPVVNPQGGAIVEGTTVYNTNTTSTGAVTDVHPGIYVWDGTNWVVHYKKRQSELYNQTAILRTQANFAGNWQDVPGLGVADAKTFTAKYSGLYRIEVKTNFAGGRTETNNSIFVSMASGQFRFLFNGTAYPFETTAFSAYSDYINSGTYYEGIWKESYETTYLNLVAGTTYPFSLCFDAYDAPGFIGNGSTAPGGPTLIDLINEDFDPNGSYTVTQTHTPDADCPTNGWIVSSANPCTSGCAGNGLYINSDDSGCAQNATAYMSFTPTINSVDISFDYLFRERDSRNDSFRVYLRNETTSATTDLVLINNSGSTITNASYSGTVAVVPGTAYTIRFQYTSNTARYAFVDNVVISELSGPIGPPSDLGCGYIGNEVDCQIEFTYIGE